MYTISMARYSTDERPFGFERITDLTEAQANAIFDALLTAQQKGAGYLYAHMARVDRDEAGELTLTSVRFAKDTYEGISKGFSFKEEPVPSQVAVI